MSIRITHRADWHDHQAHGCMACNKMATMKIEVRVNAAPEGKEWGPAQTLRLCRNHADITYGLLQGELEDQDREENRF